VGVFALASSLALFRDAAIDAAYELGWFDALARGARTVDELADAAGIAGGRHRVRALVDALVAIGVLVREGEAVTRGEVPPRPEVVREGWGRLAEVMRADRPLALGPDPTAYHQHLVRAGADSARELARLVTGATLLDLGGGAGAYTAAFLDAHPGATATLVDFADILALAHDHLAPFGDRVQLVTGDAREVTVAAEHAVVLLANVLHLHGPTACAELCAAAVRAVAPGGVVAIVELRPDSPEGPWFALDMALYTERGDVYAAEVLHGWLSAAGLIEIASHRLAAAPEIVVVVGRRPRGAGLRFVEHTGLAEPAAQVDAELGEIALPAPLRLTLTHAIALERREGHTEQVADLLRHYTETMPAQRAAQRASEDPLLHTPFAWDHLPRLSHAIDRLFAVLADASVDATRALGAPTAEAFRARTPTLAALYERTHYGGVMPLLYGNLADLAYFRASGSPQEAIDRYLTTPILHELCHLSRDRDALHPLHLDECVAGWLGVHVHPEFAYPAIGYDDAIFAAPWLSQIGQAFARAFGIRALIRAHAGAEPWDAALPAAFVDAAVRLGWEDWRARRTLHFLSNTLDPAPWVALALVAGAGGDLTGATLADLAATPLSGLVLPLDPEFDRAIVEDALRAMCLENVRIEGSFRARTVLPDGLVTIDARTCTMTTARRGDVDIVDPCYWIPPAVGARILAAGRDGYRVRLTTIEAIPAAATAIASASPPGDYPGFALAP